MTRLTARRRLALFYGVLFLVSGAILVAFVMFIALPPLNSTPPAGSKGSKAYSTALAVKNEARDELRAQLIFASLLGVGAMSVIALGSGLLMARQVLRPIRAVSSTARRLSEQDLHRRIPVSGPDDEFRELAETFNGMLTRLERAFASQRMFTANASHELRGPMATQRALVEVVLATPDSSPDATELAESLRSVLHRQERLVNGLFELASSQHGVQRQVPVRLDGLTGGVLARWRDKADAAGVSIEEDLAAAEIVGDPELVEILVDNLVRNAITHNGPDGTVWVRTAERAITIGNTGPPVAPQRLSELCEPFRRGPHDRTNGTPGSGLGLAIVDTVARAHGATTELSLRPGGGIVVTVTFPC